MMSASVSVAFADIISKTFEFGEGTLQPRSHVRTFNVPCGTVGGIAAVVKFKRLGKAGTAADVPIIIELREPDTAANQEGPIALTRNASATTTEQSLTLSSQSSNRGCSSPWRVRVSHAERGTPVKTFGSIRIDFDGRAREIESGSNASLNRGSSVTRNIGDVQGLHQGSTLITATWRHIIFGVTYGPNPVRLRFELIDPTGNVVKTVTAFSSDELRSELEKFRLIYQIAVHSPGQWKLRITNVDDDDATSIDPTVTFTPGCS